MCPSHTRTHTLLALLALVLALVTLAITPSRAFMSSHAAWTKSAFGASSPTAQRSYRGTSISQTRSNVVRSVFSSPANLSYLGYSNNALIAGLTTATVTTDKSKYAPGETVIISGSGWQAGETVTLLVQRAPMNYADQTLSSVVDGSGNFTNTNFIVQPNDLGVTFTLTATGQGSGSTAQATFTDDALKLRHGTAGRSTSVLVELFDDKANLTCAGSPNSSFTAAPIGDSFSNYGIGAPGSVRLTAANPDGQGGAFIDWVSTNGRSFTCLNPATCNQICVPWNGNSEFQANYGVATCSTIPTHNVTGGGSYCMGGSGVHVGLDGSDLLVNYQLVRDGTTNVGSPVMGTGISSIDFGLQTVAGNYTVVAIDAVNSSCTQLMNGSAIVTVNPLPTAYDVTGGGAYCQGGSGVPVGLSNSQTGVNYQLVRSNSTMDGNVGSPVAGNTGMAISFGNQTVAGTYTVVATDTTTACTNNMSGNAVVTVNPLPTAFTVTGGGAYCMGGSGVPVGLNGSEMGVNYQLVLNGATNVGSPKPGTGMALDFGNQTMAGTYTVVATNTMTMCTNTMSGSATVTVNPLPTAFTVTGGGAYCMGGSGVPVGLSNSQTGVNYQLVRSNSTMDGNVGSPVAGSTGMAISFGNQTVAGTYTVVATDTTTMCTNNMSGSATVTVNPLPTAYDVTGGGAFCSTGTGVPVGLSNSETGVNYQLVRNGVTNVGSPVPGSTGMAISFGNQTVAGTYTVVATNTTTMCTNNMNGSVSVTVQNCSVTAQDPAVCTAPGNIVSVTASITNNNGTLASNLDATLPPQLQAFGVCSASVGTCVVVNASSVTWSGTLAPGQTVTINYQAQVANGTPPNTQLCINSSITFGTPPGPATVVTACVTVNCPVVGPGTPPPAAAAVSDQKPGSVLFYNLYTSDPTNLNRQNTRINITNTDEARSVAVHLFFVDGSNCSPADAFICLTPNQTMSFLASDFDPGTTGYIIALASDSRTGCPINFNFLIGDEFVKLTSGHQANLAAEAFSALVGNPPLCPSGTLSVTLNFDGMQYNQVPKVLAVDNFPSRADGNNTLLILNRIGGDLSTAASRIGTITGVLYDEAEQPYSFTFTADGCQFRNSLSNNFPRILQRLDTIVPSGRSGWMRFWAGQDSVVGRTPQVQEVGLLGAMINFNVGAGANAFNQGHNLHKLTFTSATLTIPIILPACQ